jgi:DNA-binding LacI/PurR family transcriptional regulator
MLDVAKMAGVSTTTISRIINGKGPVNIKTRLRVEKAMKELNYTPNYFAQGMRTQKTKLIAVIVPDYSNPGYTKMYESIEETARQQGYLCVVFNTGSDPERELHYIKEIIKRQIEGIIYYTYSGRKENINFLKDISKQIPVVFMDNVVGEDEVPCVRTDGFKATREAVKYLVNEGKRTRIGYIKAGYRAARERYQGYRKALEDCSIEFDPSLVYEGDFSMKSGFDGARYMMSLSEPPDAIMAATDLMAIGIIKYLKQAGIAIPEEVSVIGFDNMPLCTIIEPSLTTIGQPMKKIGQIAAGLLIEKINNPKMDNRQILLDGSLIVRRSTDKTKPSIFLSEGL